MTIQATYSASLETVNPVTLTDTSQTTIYTAPDNYSILAGFKLVNTTGSAIAASCFHYTLADTTNRVIYRKSVPANDTVEVDSVARPMRAGDIFKVTAAADLVIVPVIMRRSSNQAV